MTAIEKVRRARRALGAGAIAGALAWGIAGGLGVIAVLSFASLLVPDLDRAPAGQGAAGIAAGLATFMFFVWRARHLVSPGRVALWIEEKLPGLEYSLVTAIEHRRAPDLEGMEAAVTRQDIGGVVRRTIRRAVLPALGAAVTAAALLYVSPSRAFGGGRLFEGLVRPAGSAVPEGSRLEDLTVEVVPPAYARARWESHDDPSSVAALVGSRMRVRGDGPASGITALAGATALPVASSSGGWTASLVMPARPAALILRDRDYERIIVLAPKADNPPRVSLTSPARDSTLRAARLVLRLDATATDDVGVAAGYFEYMITSGSGEIFSARTVTTPVVSFGGAKRGRFDAPLDLGSLGLRQGDVVSIRAIARDVNTLSGPGVATSETRTYRIARADEYDSVSIEAAGPLPIDSSAMSQRMLIIMAEQLVKDGPKLQRAEFVKRSTQIGDMEDRIRKRVDMALHAPDSPEDQAHMEEAGHTHGPTSPREGVSDDMKLAYDELWSAVRSLQIAEPDSALPHMRLALAALDRIRLANRFYLRGLPPKVIVDLAHVRMTGKEKGATSVRTPVTRADSARVRIEEGFSAAVELIETRPADAVKAFTLLQVDALSWSPGFASAMGEAVEAFRRGRDATLPLLRARRMLSGNPASSPGLPAWSEGW